MSESKASIRIDWFDGSLTEDTTHSNSSLPSKSDEKLKEQCDSSNNKILSFKPLQRLASMNPFAIKQKVINNPPFWNLLNEDLLGDFVVLIVTILSKLYSLDEDRVFSKILKDNLEVSKFLVSLKEYLETLSEVRLSEKSKNSLLWSDTQEFFDNVYIICNGLFNCEPSGDILKAIYQLMEVTTKSMVGVQKNHKETISDELFLQCSILKSKIWQTLLEQESSLEDEACLNKSEDYFKNIKLFPTKNDLFENENNVIKSNVVNGAYQSVEHYLDVQFKLLREDYIGSLREGLNQYNKNPTNMKYENIRIHPKVRIIQTYIQQTSIGHLIDIAWTERLNQEKFDFRKYISNKRFMYGSLLLFTNDNFETILCATVLDSKPELLNEGYIVVSFKSVLADDAFCKQYLMVESEVFFEPYYQVLKVLQNSSTRDLPMKRYLVDVQRDIKPPAYINGRTYNVLNERNEDISLSVLESNQVKGGLQGLDKSQMEAYMFALNNEFAIIQGPPGTGKTYLGTKIATALLQNICFEAPLLIVCLTNNALDQFLEEMLKTTTNLVRLGGQSKSEKLQTHNLNRLRAREKSKYSHFYKSKIREMENVFDEISKLQSVVDKCDNEILTYNTIKRHLKINGEVFELTSKKEDPVIEWLFNDSQLKISDQNDLNWENIAEELNVSDLDVKTCFSEMTAQKEIESMLNSMKYMESLTNDVTERHKMVDRLQEHINKIEERLKVFKKHISFSRFSEEINVLDSNVYDLPENDRWQLYFNAVQKIKVELMMKMNTLLQKYTTCEEVLNEINTMIDCEVLKTTRIVGLTTTVAARRHDLLNLLKSPIVIVEEAAEVLEAHIVASLTTHCQHLILIGDHKQLKPTPALHRLAIDHKLDISLFERMIQNGVPARALTTQRRMRREFVRLLVPHIYERLDSHPNVLGYPKVRGMKHNLFFYSHNVDEDSEDCGDSWSHRNTFEAKWCVALADYLRRMNYDCNDVTILTPYAGQVKLIKLLSGKHESLSDLKIMAVDNFQGNESRIVILSLVRSNKDGNIGFLKAHNRVCVALSRAKEGFYIFGNMNMLKSTSSLWEHINTTLLHMNSIGRKIIISCKSVKENTHEVNTSEDLLKISINGCNEICTEH